MKVADIAGICGFEIIKGEQREWHLFLIVEAQNGDVYQCKVRHNGVSRFDSRDEARLERDVCLAEDCRKPIEIKTDEEDWAKFYPLRDFNWVPATPKRFRIVARRINKPKRKAVAA
jgi:hypothetical protein